MHVIRLDHVQIAIPPNREDEARLFYQGLLGIPEVPKPPHLAAHGGSRFERGPLKIHLGVEENFSPARKAHPAFVVDDLQGLIALLRSRGYEASRDRPLGGYDRVYVNDPFGNRIEFMEQETARSVK